MLLTEGEVLLESQVYVDDVGVAAVQEVDLLALEGHLGLGVGQVGAGLFVGL